MKNLNKILGMVICIVLIGISANAQPEDVNETYVENIISDYINSSGINLTDYALNIVPHVVPANKLVNVFLFPENSANWTIKFRVDLNTGNVTEVIENNETDGDMNCTDVDNDAVCDDEDNCPAISNADQNDTDNDTIGNACDNCVNASNQNQTDLDGDGIGDACDNETGNKISKPIKLAGNETSYVKDIVNNNISSSGINLTNYTLRVVPRAVPEHGKKFVNVFLFPENSTKWTMKFRVDLNSGEIIRELTKPAEAYGKSKQNKTNIKEALKIAENDTEIKKQFAMLNFTKIPHVQSSGNVKAHIIFVPMNAYEKVKSGLEKKHNVTVIDVNVSIADKKIIRSEIKEIKEQLKENKTNGKQESGENKTNGKSNKPESVDNETDGKHNDTNGNNGSKNSGGKSKDKD